MRILTWNLRQANLNSLIWELIKLYKADILLLQEVINLPKYFLDNYYFVLKNAIKKDGFSQKFKTAILSRFEITEEIELKSKYKSINKQLKLNLGNYIYVKIKYKSDIINCISLHSPAWSIDNDKLDFKDYLSIKLKNNSKICLTELIYSGLKEIININENWIIGGDFNSSETFDKGISIKK